MSLPYFDFCYSTSGDIATVYLELSSQYLLGHSFRFSNTSYIITYQDFHCTIHDTHPLRLFRNKGLDMIVQKC